MVQLVHQLLSPNRHPQTPGVGEVRQPPSPRLVLLSENDLARRPVLRLPAPNPSLQRPPNPRMTPHHLFVQRHRPQPRVRLQQRHDLLVEYPRQRVGASPPPRLLHRPTPRIPFDPMRRRPAEPRLRRRQRRPVLPSSGHVQLHLVVRNPSARHFASLLIPGKHQSSNLPPPPPAVSPCLSQASHPDCRATKELLQRDQFRRELRAHRNATLLVRLLSHAVQLPRCAHLTHPSDATHPSQVTRPPATVRTTGISLIASGSASCGSAPSTTKSASLPTEIDPLRSSSNDA